MESDFADADWDNVDASHSPQRYIEFLERISDTEWAQRAKEASYRAMRPSEGDVILDVGCGIGIDVDGLAEYVGSDGTVIGVDNSEAMVEEARARYGDTEAVQFEVDDATSLSFDDDRFDRARTERVLQHLSSPQDAITELKRVTRSGGLVMATEPDWTTYVLDMPGSEIATQVMDPEFASVQNPGLGQTLSRRFSEAGFADVQVQSYSLTIDDAERAVHSFRLQSRLKLMMEDDRITPEEADQWLQDLRQASENDRFLAAGTAFSVVARNP